jgi:hypothetical protein
MMPRDEYFLGPNEDTITGIDWARIRNLILSNREKSQTEATEMKKITVKDAVDDGDYKEEDDKEAENDISMKRTKREITEPPVSGEHARFHK